MVVLSELTCQMTSPALPGGSRPQMTQRPPCAAEPARSSWLTLEASRRSLDVLSLLPAGPLPVNCLDVTDDRLLCGGDNEVLHCISRLAV